MNLKNRTLFIGDNLKFLRGINSESVDLIYLDPPFNKKKQFKAPIGSPAEGAEFKDIWTDEDVKEEWRGEIASKHQDLYEVIEATGTLYDKSMSIYLTAMSIRLFEMKRVLKKTGSIYLHCDHTANHYLKLCMDGIFGKNNFLGDISWNKCNGVKTRTSWGNENDNILCYAKAIRKHTFNTSDPVCRKPYSDTSLSMHFTHEDEDGRLYRKRIVNGKTYIYYADDGRFIGNLWDDIPSMSANSPILNEATGWPTQKPLDLLKRIVTASSNEGDFVLDPFCGCATACVAAELLGRRWVGIDISPSAEVITKYRLDEARHTLEGTQAFDPEVDVIVSDKPPRRTDVKIPRAADFKPQLYSKQDGKCTGCKIYFPYRNMTIDHKRPKSKGGTNEVDNLQLLCHVCNATKGTGTQKELIAKLRERGVIE